MVAPSAWRDASLGDVIAGATVAATSLPQYIAYAELAGLSGLHGLRTSGPPLVVFAFVTRSPLLSIGVTSITAIMAHATLRGAEYREVYGDEAWIDLLGAFATLVGLVSFVLGLLGATRLASLLPGAVRSGWKLGFALVVVASQGAGAFFGEGARFVKARCVLPHLGSAGGGTPISGGAAAMYRLAWTLCQPQLWDPSTLALSALALAMVLWGRPLLGRALRAVTRRKALEPMVGAEVVVATVATTLMATVLGYQGGIVGTMPASASLPDASNENEGYDEVAAQALRLLTFWVRRWPWEMPWQELAARLGGWPWAVASAVAFAGVDFLAIVSVVDSGPLGQEMYGQGVGCIVSGMAGSAPIGGSLSRSLVARMTGASSPLAGLVNGLCTMALALPYVAGWLAPMPKAVLAAVVLAAVLPSVAYPKELLQLAGADAAVAWTTCGVCALTDPTKGFIAGIALHALLRPFRRKVG